MIAGIPHDDIDTAGALGDGVGPVNEEGREFVHNAARQAEFPNEVDDALTEIGVELRKPVDEALVAIVYIVHFNPLTAVRS
jgi:hypothetical protein